MGDATLQDKVVLLVFLEEKEFKARIDLRTRARHELLEPLLSIDGDALLFNSTDSKFLRILSKI